MMKSKVLGMAGLVALMCFPAIQCTAHHDGQGHCGLPPGRESVAGPGVRQWHQRGASPGHPPNWCISRLAPGPAGVDGIGGAGRPSLG